MLSEKQIIRAGFVVFGTLLGATGVFKFFQVTHIIGSVSVNQFLVNLIHDWSGISIILLSILNAVLKKRAVAKSQIAAGQSGSAGLRPKVLLVAVLLAAAAFGIYYFATLDRAAEQLAAAQVKEYQGQNLSSITAIQDNAINGTQRLDVNQYRLSVAGMVANPKQFTYAEVLNLQKYQKVVELDCVEGWSAKILWEGVLVKDLVAAAGGAAPGAKIAIFYASDGYTTSLPLDYLENNNILLADKMNGVIIPQEKGFPFQLVAEQKWGYKWIKWITKIELSDDVNFRGPWEKAGYNNNGDVTGPKSAQ